MKSIEFKSLLIGILGSALVMMLIGKSVFQPEPYQIQCVHLEDTIGMSYIACRLFDMNNISKQKNPQNLIFCTRKENSGNFTRKGI